MKKINKLFILIASLFLVASCSSGGTSSLSHVGGGAGGGFSGGSGEEDPGIPSGYDTGDGKGEGSGEGSYDAPSDSAPGEGEPGDEVDVSPDPDPVSDEGPGDTGLPTDEPEEEEEEEYPSEHLTCSALDDNKFYDYWQLLGGNNQQSSGIFYNYRKGYDFNTYNRVDLTINNGNDVTVSIVGDPFITKVDNLHKAYLFPKTEKDEYEVEISYLDKNNERQKIRRTVENEDVIDLGNAFSISKNLEIMFVIDATGSMMDEMNYLKAEIDNVISNVKEKYSDANISLAIMVYRDEGDEYVTKYSDFTTDIEAQRKFLKKQKADGGGDTPEAVDVALEEAVNKQWSAKSTKLLFHVADAPSHDEGVSRWNLAALKAAEKGIKIISVASSGIDKMTEYFFRSQSLLTAGQYVYLTDDSGIGATHLDASTNEKLVVEYLNACMSRLISGYYSGVFEEPVPYDQK